MEKVSYKPKLIKPFKKSDYKTRIKNRLKYRKNKFKLKSRRKLYLRNYRAIFHKRRKRKLF